MKRMIFRVDTIDIEDGVTPAQLIEALEKADSDNTDSAWRIFSITEHGTYLKLYMRGEIETE